MEIARNGGVVGLWSLTADLGLGQFSILSENGDFRRSPLATLMFLLPPARRVLGAVSIGLCYKLLQ